MTSDLETLLKIIEEKLTWGNPGTWQSDDFENLHQLILQETGVSLSTSTLRRIWGRVEYGHLPSGTTLNTLAKFGGYENWRAFLMQQLENNITVTADPEVVPQKIKKPVVPWFKIAMATVSIVVISLVSIFGFRKAPRQIKPADYSFSSNPLTHEIPNSVIFTYDATASPTDSIFIQQSWDSRRKTVVEKGLHKHVSVYYEPGFYKAKLIIDSQVVKEHPLLIPTNGWLGMIDKQPVPVYIKNIDFISDSVMRLPVNKIQQNNITMEPEPPVIKYCNVGNFNPVAVNDFSFSAALKNEFREGAAACQFATIILITDDNPIIIPLSVKGCVAELNLLSIDHFVSGKKADLSGFGADFSSWATVSCRSTAKTIQYYVNDKLAYESPLPAKPVNIVGMEYMFQGTGAVKNIQLESKGKQVFHAF